ncbi:MAG TPA: helicase-associated domain-containing protein [Candidatus Corynebacterium avicola]|uniref:Helicase-associated domain-containing protein n=1 Tax=Candidatus Corynebacterium avicola TaxID=2838527 RepID=A0A9D1RMR6_9CORY|nr:helicase-associated domain-containing protein [Candidatus Corynebacterium avicola]
MPTEPTTSASAAPDAFPTYSQWLASHSDGDLVDLLWRLRAFHPVGLSVGGGTTSRGAGSSAAVLGAVTDIAALRRLTALDLAVLQALVIAGASVTPVTREDLDDELRDLFDVAETPATHRPDAAAVDATVRSLAGWGLVFGPGLALTDSTDTTSAPGQMMVPSHMPPLFAGVTDIPWVLADGYRCPVPTADLPETLAELPARQRRLLQTLEASGGIGHSATLNDPERPLAKMIAAGLLDQVDDQTARLSPRVAASISGRVVPSPGGDFRPVGVHSATDAEESDTDSSRDRVDGAAVSRIVDTARIVAEVLEEMGRSPLRPLNAGGVGVREITRLAKSLDQSPETTRETLALCHHADLIGRGVPLPSPQDATGPDEQWAVTDRGARYVSAPLSRRWAMLLDGWSRSEHAPSGSVVAQDAHLLEETLDRSRLAALRGLVAGVVTVADGADHASALWRTRPAVASVTAQDDLDQTLVEAVSLGLLADGAASSAAHVLAELEDTSDTGTSEDVLTDRLSRILPAPVSMLIIQGDMTILAPGLLDTETELMLRQFAEVESTGMASVWRVTRQSMERAVDAGLDSSDILGFLAGMAPEIPQALTYLVEDTVRTHRRVEPVVATTAASVLTAPDADTMTALLASPAAEEVGLHRIAPTVAVSSTQLSVVLDALDEDGQLVRVAGGGGDGSLSAGRAASPTAGMSTVPDPERPDATREDVDDQLAGAVEAFRRALQHDDDADGGPGTTGDGVTVHEPGEIMDALRQAYNQGTQVQINYVNASGSAVREWISVVTMSPVAIVGVTESGGESLRIQPHRVASVTT